MNERIARLETRCRWLMAAVIVAGGLPWALGAMPQWQHNEAAVNHVICERLTVVDATGKMVAEIDGGHLLADTIVANKNFGCGPGVMIDAKGIVVGAGDGNTKSMLTNSMLVIGKGEKVFAGVAGLHDVGALMLNDPASGNDISLNSGEAKLGWVKDETVGGLSGVLVRKDK